MVPTPGLEPGRPYRTRDFKSLASTIPPSGLYFYYNTKKRITLIIIFYSILFTNRIKNIITF